MQLNKPKYSVLQVFRFVVRCLALCVAVVLGLQVLPWNWSAVILPAISPFAAICSAVATRALSVVLLLALPVFVMSLLNGRWFCRWLCPVGFLSDTIGRVRRGGRGGNFSNWPRISHWLVLLTLGGAVLGYPMFLWMDPLAIFNSFFGIFGAAGFAIGLLSAAALLVALLVNLLATKLWCHKICPLGATQELLFQSGKSVWARKKLANREGVLSARRAFLFMGAGALGGFGIMKVLPRSTSKPIRPPGAIDDQRFTGVCIRCGNCVRVCPAEIIQPDIGGYGPAGFMTPIVKFDKNYCQEDCNNCNQVCPSGAIRRMSLEEKKKTQMGIARVNMAKCILNDNKECERCINDCPYEAIDAYFSEQTYQTVLKVNAEKCVGCGACELICPVSAPKAITIEAVSEG